MYIHAKKKAVVLKLRHPSRVTEVIPTAKQVTAHTVALPHRPDETRVLRNLGFSVPDPMPIHYVYPLANGRFKPFEVQNVTATFLSMNHRAFCLNDMGCGKTNSALWAFDYLRSVRQAKKMLVVCPLSTMERTWGDAVFSTFPHLDFTVLYGTRERRLKLLAQDAHVYIINIDGLAIIQKELSKRPDIDVICIDELAMARNAQTERWKILNNICNGSLRRRVWGMTGSPTPNAPTDAWAQCRLVTPDNPEVPRFFGRFKDSVMRQITPFKWVPRETANDTVFKCMQPAIRFSLDDCVDLPEQVVLTREVDLTAEQTKAYKAMMTTLATEVAGGQILAVNEAVKANKLVQIACLRGDTEVLTSAGWLPISEVPRAVKVWDGTSWVRHDGCIYKGMRRTISLGGVHLTDDHQVLSDAGWVTAKELRNGRTTTGKRLNRTDVRLPYGATKNRTPREWLRSMGVRMRLWLNSGANQSVSSVQAQLRSDSLRVPTWEPDARDGEVAPLQHLEPHESSVHQTREPRLSAVWRKGYNSVRAMAGVVRELLGGHGGNLRARAIAGQKGQRRSVHPHKLPVGYPSGASKQSQTQAAGGNSSYGGENRHTDVDAVRTQTERGPLVAVYDLVNCGTQNRFVVRGKQGEHFIVHNCGVAYGTNGENIIIPCKPRTDAVKEIIEESEGKVIVFVPLTGALEAVAKEISTMFSEEGSVRCVHGGTSKSDRDTIFKEFQQQETPRVLVANAQTMSHGLTLTAATTIIWYAPVHSNETYSQANARVRRPGQTRKTRIVHVAGTEIERKIYKRLAAKESMQGVLLDMVKENNGVEQ